MHERLAAGRAPEAQDGQFWRTVLSAHLRDGGDDEDDADYGDVGGKYGNDDGDVDDEDGQFWRTVLCSLVRWW